MVCKVEAGNTLSGRRVRETGAWALAAAFCTLYVCSQEKTATNQEANTQPVDLEKLKLVVAENSVLSKRISELEALLEQFRAQTVQYEALHVRHFNNLGTHLATMLRTNLAGGTFDSTFFDKDMHRSLSNILQMSADVPEFNSAHQELSSVLADAGYQFFSKSNYGALDEKNVPLRRTVSCSALQ